MRRLRALDKVSIAAIGGTASQLAAEARGADEAGIDCVWAPELLPATGGPLAG